MFLEVQNLYIENVDISEYFTQLSKYCRERYNACVSWYAYILHNKDVNVNGEIKKEHYHLMLEISDFNSHVGVNNAFAPLNEMLNLKLRYQIIKNPKKFARYLIHLDDKDKFQYDVKKVITNDSEIYLNLIQLSIKINKYDQALNEFILYAKSCEIMPNDYVIYNWFMQKNLLDYCMKNIDKIKNLMRCLCDDTTPF